MSLARCSRLMPKSKADSMRRKNDEKIAENRFRFYFQFSTLYFSFRYRFSLLLRLFFDFNLSQFFNFFHPTPPPNCWLYVIGLHGNRLVAACSLGAWRRGRSSWTKWKQLGMLNRWWPSYDDLNFRFSSNIAIATDGFVDIDSSVALFLILTNSSNRVSHKKTTKFFVSPSAHLIVSHRRSKIRVHRPNKLTQEWEIFLMKFSCFPIMVTSSEHGRRLRDKLHSAFVCCILTASTSPFGAGSNLHIMARGRDMHRDVLCGDLDCMHSLEKRVRLSEKECGEETILTDALSVIISSMQCKHNFDSVVWEVNCCAVHIEDSLLRRSVRSHSWSTRSEARLKRLHRNNTCLRWLHEKQIKGDKEITINCTLLSSSPLHIHIFYSEIKRVQEILLLCVERSRARVQIAWAF